MYTLQSINIYPIKSSGRVVLKSVEVKLRGLAGDRRWIVVNAEGTGITGRVNPVLPLLDVKRRKDGLELRRGTDSTAVALPDETATRRSITVWDDTVNAQDAGDDIAAWLSRVLGGKFGLCYMDSIAHRTVASTESVVSFADTYPLLLTNSTSLVALNDRVGENLDMRRFRPNVVFDGDEAFEEDRWRRIRIGAVEFEVVGPCERCMFTTLDPDTSDAHPRQEPLRSLARFRRSASGEVCFGQHLVPLSTGTVHAGDPIELLETGDPRPDINT